MARAVNVQVKSRYPKDGLQIIKKFMRMVKDEGILQEYRDRMYYEKPSITRRKKRARRKRVMEKLKKENN